jgi:hypothetical protein
MKLLVLIELTLTLFGLGCSCQSVVKETGHSPDGRYVLLITRSNCGTTDPFNTEITVTKIDPRLHFEYLGHESDKIFAIDERKPSFNLQVKWQGPTHLLVVCKGCNESDIQVKHAAWEDVTIYYDVQQ